MSFIFSILFIVLLLVLFLGLSVGTFMASGYLLTLIVDLTIFEATIICLSSGFVAGFLIVLFIVSDFFTKVPGKFSRSHSDEDDYDEDEEDSEDDNESFRKRRNRFKVVRSDKVGRNAPCPCGSGKKYKNCCGV